MAEYKANLLKGLFVRAKNVINSAGGSMEDSVCCSETEHIVGKWIDGSTLYEKTVNCGGVPNSASKTVAHNISNLDNIIEIKGVAIRENTAWYPLPFNNVSNVNANIAIDVNATNIVIRTAIDYSVFTQSYVTLRYTKTS